MSDWVARANELRDQGLTHTGIAQHLGITLSVLSACRKIPGPVVAAERVEHE